VIGMLILGLLLRKAFAPSAAVNLALPAGAERICLSLRSLAQQVEAARLAGQPLPAECDTLAGLNYLEGYVLDERQGGDVVLVGLRWTNRPPLYLDDLLVNLRNVWQGKVAPYCSLDPRKEDILAWQGVKRNLFSRSNVESAELIGVLRSNIGPQMVVVDGVPTNSRHAHVMIDADYHMKKLSQGQVRLDNIVSYLEVATRSDFSRSDKAKEGSIYESQSRFWFQVLPQDLRYAFAQGIIWLSKCRIVVSTEKQAAAADGALYDVKKDDPVATAFAENLSRAFPKAALAVPDYASLEELFRLHAVLLSICVRAPAEAERLKLGTFLPHYRYAHESPMPPSLPGLVNYHEETATNSQSDGYTVSRYLTTVAGGVSMHLPLRAKSFRLDASRTLISLNRQVLAARPASYSLTWRAPSPPKSDFTTPFLHAFFLILIGLLFFKPICQARSQTPDSRMKRIHP
jgi:hypothetical protein